MRWLGPIGFLTATIATLASVAPASSQTPHRGGTLQGRDHGRADTTDCHAGGTFAVVQHLAPHYSTLLKFDGQRLSEHRRRPGGSWTAGEDGKVFTFKIRRNVKFHDGSALTSKDVAATFERLRNPPDGIVSLRKPMFAGIAAIETPDDATLVVRLSAPDTGALTMFASPWNCVYSAAKLAADPRYPEKTVMGTGPFKFVERVSGSHWSAHASTTTSCRGSLTSTASASTDELDRDREQHPGRPDPRRVPRLHAAQRDRLVAALGDKATVQESPFMTELLLSFNTERAPFSDPPRAPAR